MLELTIGYLNFWAADDYWFTHYFQHNFKIPVRMISPFEKPDIIMCSVFGDPKAIYEVTAKCKIFYTGENVANYYCEVDDPQYLQNNFDAILCFAPTDISQKIFHFPIWMLSSYYEFSSDDNLLTRIENSRKKYLYTPRKFLGSCVARHDNEGVRSILVNNLAQYGEVRCPGTFNNNCPPIGSDNLDKFNFIAEGWFNICPENSAGLGYWTEKIFQAFEAGTIPIYWASTPPEPNIINPDVYCFVDLSGDVSEQLKTALENRIKMLSEPIFLPTAANTLKTYYEDAINAIREVLKSRLNFS